MIYRVSADIVYLEGFLDGIQIPDGFAVSYPSRSAADRCAAWINRTRADDDFVRAVGTGNRFKFASAACVSIEPQEG